MLFTRGPAAICSLRHPIVSLILAWRVVFVFSIQDIAELRSTNQVWAIKFNIGVYSPITILNNKNKSCVPVPGFHDILSLISYIMIYDNAKYNNVKILLNLKDQNTVNSLLKNT